MATTYESEGPLPAACVRLERDLAGFLDGSLDAGGSEWVAEHLEACARCAALLDALGEPSEVGRAVAALPAMRAPGHLWDSVAARIAAPVVEIGQRRASSAERVSPRGWWRTGLAAAGLVVMTAGVTYTLTVRQREQAASAQVATQPAVVPMAPSVVPTATESTAPTQVTTADASPTTQPTRSTVTAVANRSALGARRSTLALPADPTRDTYDREIAKLRVVLSQRSGELDTATVRIVRRNMKVIDQAIAQSKAALARDPASGFLNKQLNNALDQKLELLRTAALLPART